MLKFKKAERRVQKPCTPNILPCRIHHDGPVDASPRYWAPKPAKGQSCSHPAQKPIHSFVTDGKPEAYFRGRKLRGQEIEVPQGYRGIVVEEAGRETTAFQNTEKGVLKGEEGEEMEEEQKEVTMLNELGSFNKLLIWNHESIVDGDDPFVKGLSEWIGFAEAVSGVFSICG